MSLALLMKTTKQRRLVDLLSCGRYRYGCRGFENPLATLSQLQRVELSHDAVSPGSILEHRIHYWEACTIPLNGYLGDIAIHWLAANMAISDAGMHFRSWSEACL